jgi:hypothetical protein
MGGNINLDHWYPCHPLDLTLFCKKIQSIEFLPLSSKKWLGKRLFNRLSSEQKLFTHLKAA